MAGDTAPPPHTPAAAGDVDTERRQYARRRRLDRRRLAAKPGRDDSTDPHVGILAAGGEAVDSVDEASAEFPCLSHGVVSLIGRRRQMEDAVAVAPGFATAAGGYDFFGIYDGHGGSGVAAVCRERMHVVLAAEVAGPVGAREEEEALWRRALAASFARVDDEVCAAAEREEVDASEKTVGSTAVVAVVGTRMIAVANCGDSRAVLSRGGVAVPLSLDHKPERPDEMERVEAAGGKVINWNGYRVLGVLATSRSIGDLCLKPYVSSEPEVMVVDRNESDEFLILASDGLWDVVTNEVACRVTRRCLTGRAARMYPESVGRRTAAEAAALLAELAISRGSIDNVSIVVVELRKMGTW